MLNTDALVGGEDSSDGDSLDVWVMRLLHNPEASHEQGSTPRVSCIT
jgi:hypothetical protein